MLFRNAVLFLGLAGAAVAYTGPYPFAPIAGYIPRTDQTSSGTDQLDKDLIQQALEFNIVTPPGPSGAEDCVGFANAQTFITSFPGIYFESLPTYTDTESEPFEEMTRYYCQDDFLQKWIRKAYQKRNVRYCGSLRAFNFEDAFIPPSDLPRDCIGFEEVLKKGISYTGFLIESYQLMQKAIDFAEFNSCIAQDNFPFGGSPPCFDAVEAWDQAAAAYIGSLEGTDGKNDLAGDYGKAPYTLGDKRCRNFRTCGPDNGAIYPGSDPKDITASINMRILALFAAGSQAAYHGDYRQMKGYLRLISNKSAVPLIQGAFRYWYRFSDLEFPFSRSDKELGEGAAFIFPLLPKLWACSKRGAKKAYAESLVDRGRNIQAGQPGEPPAEGIDFLSLQLAFECNYRCLGITCAEVGALYDGDSVPKPGFVACDDDENGSTNVCSKQSGRRKNQCRLYVGQPGIKNRNKLRFEF